MHVYSEQEHTDVNVARETMVFLLVKAVDAAESWAVQRSTITDLDVLVELPKRSIGTSAVLGSSTINRGHEHHLSTRS